MFAEVLEECVTMTHTERDEQLRANELARRELDTSDAALLGTTMHQGSYRDDGHRSPNAFVRATLDVGDANVSGRRKRARLMCDFPQVGDAMLHGRFSVDHADQIARLQANRRTAAILPIVIGALIEDAERESFAEFRSDIDEFSNQIDDDGAFADLAEEHQRRDAHVHDLNGSLEMRTTGGDPITTAQVVAVFEGFVEREYHNDLAARRDRYGDDAHQHPLDRTPAQRRHDALVAVFAAAAASPEGRALPEPTVDIVIDEQSAHDALTHAGITLPDGDEVAIDADTDPDGALAQSLADELVRDPRAYRQRRCETSTGTKIHPLVALRALLTGHVRRVVVNSRGVVVDRGTKQRLFTGSAREAALLLAQTCTYPGCRLPARMCQVDHITPWSTGGPTNQTNANIECAPHNIVKHTQQLRVLRDDHGRPHHLKPDGTIILPVGQRPPDLSADELTHIIRARAAQLRPAS